MVVLMLVRSWVVKSASMALEQMMVRLLFSSVAVTVVFVATRRVMMVVMRKPSLVFWFIF